MATIAQILKDNGGIIPIAPGSGTTGDPYAGVSEAARKAAAAAAAAQARAEASAKAELAAQKAAGKSQTKKENANTQKIINTLLGSIKGYTAGRDQSLKNAASVFNTGISSLQSQYGQTVADLQASQDQNEADETSKTFANRANRAREQQSILDQIQSQGAGETDALRSLVQAFENQDANQLDITTSYYDSLNSANSGLRQANAANENARNNLWGQKEDSRAQAWENFYNNYTQIFTDAQRTAASNSNINSAYSTAFNPTFGGKDPLKEATRYAGKQYAWKAPATGWAGDWAGKVTELGQKVTTPTLGAAATRIGGLKRAEGATLRKDEEL
jgi:hypothetical protein